MRFVLDGEEFELTAEQVRSRLAGRVPDPIQEHWIEIEGQRWPVKQAFALATRTDKQRFVSLTARRHLSNLGFVVGGGGGTRGAVPTATRPARPGLDIAALPVLETVVATVSFAWRAAGPIALDAAGIPVFPPLPSAPGLYRFDFRAAVGEGSTIYIGESVDLARRASNYRNAKTDRSRQRTSRRIHKDMVEHLAGGGRLDCAIAVAAALGDGGSALDLRRKSARRFAENAAVLLALLDGHARVLNIDADLSHDGQAEDDQT